MGQSNDSSVLFSLQQLMGLEEERIEREDAEQKRVEAAAARARLDAEQRVREAEEARLRASEDERRAREQRAREEAVRLEAIRHAELEKARLDAENSARMAAVQRQQSHERELAAMHETSGKRRLTVMLGALGAVLIAATIAGGILLREQTKKAEDAQAALRIVEAQVADLDARKRSLENEKLAAVGSKDALDALNEKLRAIEVERDRLQKTPATVSKSPAGANKHAPAFAPKPAAKPCDKTCQKGDPLCVGCL